MIYLVLKHTIYPDAPADLGVESSEVVGAYGSKLLAELATEVDRARHWQLDTDGGEDPEQTWEDRYEGDIRYTTQELKVVDTPGMMYA